MEHLVKSGFYKMAYLFVWDKFFIFWKQYRRRETTICHSFIAVLNIWEVLKKDRGNIFFFEAIFFFFRQIFFEAIFCVQQIIGKLFCLLLMHRKRKWDVFQKVWVGVQDGMKIPSFYWVLLNLICNFLEKITRVLLYPQPTTLPLWFNVALKSCCDSKTEFKFKSYLSPDPQTIEKFQTQFINFFFKNEM